jgi:phosphatidylserine decarboxylase
MLNKVESWELGRNYYILQIADYDVDSITPFDLSAQKPYSQNERFSQIRYGSQVDLIVPLGGQFDFEFVWKVGTHVEAGVDPLLRILNHPTNAD